MRFWGGCLLVLLTVPLSGNCSGHPCDGTLELTDMVGDILMIGGPSDTGDGRICTWRVYPRNPLVSITFRFGEVRVGKNDSLDVYNYHGDHVAAYTQESPPGSELRLLDNRAAHLVLFSKSAGTYIEVSYSSEVPEQLEEPSNPRIPNFLLLAVLIFICVGVVTPLAAIVYWRDRRQHDRVMRESRAIQRSRYMRWVRTHDTAEERRVMSLLGSLPEQEYKDSQMNLQECRLCLEPFQNHSMLRLLPCKHYYHKECIDKWFSTDRFRVRRCPLCNANPLPSNCGSGSSRRVSRSRARQRPDSSRTVSEELAVGAACRGGASLGNVAVVAVSIPAPDHEVESSNSLVNAEVAGQSSQPAADCIQVETEDGHEGVQSAQQGEKGRSLDGPAARDMAHEECTTPRQTPAHGQLLSCIPPADDALCELSEEIVQV